MGGSSSSRKEVLPGVVLKCKLVGVSLETFDAFGRSAGKQKPCAREITTITL